MDNTSGSGEFAIKRNTSLSRRSFFGILLGISSAGIGAVLSARVLRYVVDPISSKATRKEWSDLSEVSEFVGSKDPVHKTITFTKRDGWREIISSQSVYVSRDTDGKLQVLSAICPHLGCSVSWQAHRGKFVCPCHGGEFQASGEHISGPPPRAMDRLPSQIQDGKLQVQFECFRSNVPHQEVLS